MNKSEKLSLAKEIRRTHLSTYQRQVVLGTLMGDASFNVKENGSCRIQMAHSIKQKAYLEWKKEILSPFFLMDKPTEYISYKNNVFNSKPNYHYSSIVHQDFTDLYGLFHSDNTRRKGVTMNVLNAMTELSVLVWFLDDGCYHYQQTNSTHSMYLSTYCFTLSEHNTMKKWFWHKWRVDIRIAYDATHKSYTLRLNKENMVKFNNIFLKPFLNIIPDCMHYKFPNFS